MTRRRGIGGEELAWCGITCTLGMIRFGLFSPIHDRTPCTGRKFHVDSKYRKKNLKIFRPGDCRIDFLTLSLPKNTFFWWFFGHKSICVSTWDLDSKYVIYYPTIRLPIKNLEKILRVCRDIAIMNSTIFSNIFIR